MTYSSGILAEEILSAFEKIDEWLGKPVVITCDEVTAAQLPPVIECACHTTRVESVVFNISLDEIKSDSNPSGHSYAGSPSVQGVSGTTFLNKMPGLPWFSGTEREKNTVRFEQWLHSISDARKTFNKQLVRTAINKTYVGDVVDAICCFPLRATLDDIIEKCKWLYGSVESFDTLMQEFYQIVQGKCERVQTVVPHLGWALKVIKQQHPHAMTEEEGVKHLKDWLFHGLKTDIQTTIYYMYDMPNLQYNQLVMAARKAKTETSVSNVSEARVKSAEVGID